MAAGLNAYIPLFALGILHRMDVVHLSAGWDWLASWPSMAIVGTLLVIEIVVDKVPAIDSINDAVQTVVRPAAGAMVFTASAASGTPALDGVPQIPTSDEMSWVPYALGVVFALFTHGTKAAARPIANVGTAGLAAPVVSTAEDASSIGLVAAAVFAPVIVAIAAIALAVLLVWIIYRWRSRHKRYEDRRVESFEHELPNPDRFS